MGYIYIFNLHPNKKSIIFFELVFVLLHHDWDRGVLHHDWDRGVLSHFVNPRLGWTNVTKWQKLTMKRPNIGKNIEKIAKPTPD